MLFVFLWEECGVLKMKTFTKEEKDEALDWHRRHPKAVSLIGSGPMPENYILEFLNGDNQESSK